MGQQYIGEIRIFAGNFAPRDWAFCDGTLLPIAQNTALFAILGTTFGGDGRTTVGLPNLQGRLPLHAGRGPGLQPRTLGQVFGTETVTLTDAQTASHTHTLRAVSDPGDLADPTNRVLARSAGGNAYLAAGNLVNMDANALTPVGAAGAHNNLQPYLVLNFIIALNGVFPTRS
ncbi:MAG: phage tail protein [Dehalococcoidia bacterium]